MPDSASRPGDGNGQQYELPDEYGPARQPRRARAETGPSVVVRPVDATAVLVSDDLTAKRALSRASQQPRSPWVWRSIAIVVVIAFAPVVWSYVDALRAPGTDSIGVRTVDWVRDHGGNDIVNTIDRWRNTNNPPAVGGEPPKLAVQETRPGVVAAPVIPAYVPASAPTPPIQQLEPPTARVPTPAPVVEQNEGVWQATGRTVGGIPAVYTTYVRPDAEHTSYYTGLMWLDTKLLRASYVVGTQEPGGGPNAWGSKIPGSLRPSAVAAFNSGFAMEDARGGAWLDGRTIKPLADGLASLVIRKDGSTSVGVWGRDFAMGPDIQAVRQNLELLVDNGRVNPEVRENDTGAFESTVGNSVLVWRSGVGVDANGGLIYAGGPAMSLHSVARTLHNAGAVRAMALDFNRDSVSAYTYVPRDADTGSETVGVKLLDDMARGGDRYLRSGERDFFAFIADPKFL